MNTRAWLGVAAASVVLATPAGAALVCVEPTGAGGCYKTIQEGVNAAAAGDAVVVANGVYYENVTIPSGKDSLQLIGRSRLRAILDPDVPNNGNGITIQSSSVQVRNLGIRNGQANGIEVYGNAVLIQNVRIIAARGPYPNQGYGIYLAGGAGHRVLSNEIRAVNGYGIVLTGDGSLAQGNVIAHTWWGILGSGQRLQVLANRMSGVGGGIDVRGGDVRVAGNTIEAAGYGMYVEGRDPVVKSNRLTAAGGLEVRCTSCTGGSVTANKSAGSYDVGLRVFADAPGLVVERNTATESRNRGIYVEGTGVRLAQNVAMDTGLVYGTSGGDCYYLEGTGHTLGRNTATRCGHAGFHTWGDGMSLDRNLATDTGVSGFAVNGGGGTCANATLTSNRAVSSNGQGFAVVGGAINTVFTGNVDSKSRVGFCDEGVGTNTSGGNSFGATSTTCGDVVQ
jgi:hypothetical protein